MNEQGRDPRYESHEPEDAHAPYDDAPRDPSYRGRSTNDGGYYPDSDMIDPPRFWGFRKPVRGSSVIIIVLCALAYGALSLPHLKLFVVWVGMVAALMSPETLPFSGIIYLLIILSSLLFWFLLTYLLLRLHYHSWRIIEEVPPELRPGVGIWPLIILSFVPYARFLVPVALFGYWADRYVNFVKYWRFADAPVVHPWVFWFVSVFGMVDAFSSNQQLLLWADELHVFYYAGVVYALWMKCQVVNYFKRYRSGGVRHDWALPEHLWARDEFRHGGGRR